MNQTELLDQFVIEARECLEAIGERLLEVERDPTNGALLNDLFRSVHTLKGNCGLFEFKALETVVHAGEDLLDRVRNHTLAYSDELADALLEAMDYSAQLIDQIERQGRIDPSAAERSGPIAASLRALLDGGSAMPAPAAAPTQPAVAAAPSAPARTSASPRPAWLDRLPAELLYANPHGIAVRYQPEPDCFFKGEDPWRLASTLPGLLQVHVDPQQPWPQAEALNDWDCYRCNLDLVLLSHAPLDEVQAHFRCVPEQIAVFEMASLDADTVPSAATPSAAEQTLQRRALAMWLDQIALLSRPGIAAGTVLAAERALRGLLAAWSDRTAFDRQPRSPAPPGRGGQPAGLGASGIGRIVGRPTRWPPPTWPARISSIRGCCTDRRGR